MSVARGESRPAARKSDTRLVTKGREVINAGQTHDPPPGVLGFGLAMNALGQTEIGHQPVCAAHAALSRVWRSRRDKFAGFNVRLNARLPLGPSMSRSAPRPGRMMTRIEFLRSTGICGRQPFNK